MREGGEGGGGGKVLLRLMVERISGWRRREKERDWWVSIVDGKASSRKKIFTQVVKISCHLPGGEG